MTAPDSRHIADELLEVQRTLGWMDLVISSLSDAVYVTDKEHRLVFVNQCFADITGTPRVFLLGKKVDEVLQLKRLVNESNENDKHHRQFPGTAEGENGIYQLVTEDDGKLIMKISSRKLDTTGQTVYLAQDITDEYQLSHMKTNFINLASHQLRTPMTAIMSYSHMLQEGYGGPLTDQQKKLSGTIITASERMIRLINDLLKITRLQNDEPASAGRSASLIEVLAQIHTELSPRIKEKAIHFEIDAPSDDVRIKADKAIIHEIFSNLIVNAVQYTPQQGSIYVTIKPVKFDVVEVKVKDTGIGIPLKDQGRLFNQFSRADNALPAHPEGTGLGLYLIKLLIDKIGADITFESRLHKGTTFILQLPTGSRDGADEL